MEYWNNGMMGKTKTEIRKTVLFYIFSLFFRIFQYSNHLRKLEWWNVALME